MLWIKSKRGEIVLYIQCNILLSKTTTLGKLIFFNLPIFYCRFVIFRRCLDAEIKDSTRLDLNLQIKKEDKEAVSA